MPSISEASAHPIRRTSRQSKPTEKWRAVDPPTAASNPIKRHHVQLTTEVSKMLALSATSHMTSSQASLSTAQISTPAPLLLSSSHRVTVQTEDEEIALHAGAEVIDIDEDGTESESTLSKKAGSSEPENLDVELDQLAKYWTSPIYAFFEPKPTIEYIAGRCCHSFKCLSKSCKKWIRRYLDKADTTSISNMSKHVASCWRSAVLEDVMSFKTADDAHDSVVKTLWTGTITEAFEQKGKGKVTYSHRQHTKSETRAEIICWVSESLRPFNIVNDRGFNCLIKMGRPEHYIPSPSTVSRDVRLVFANCHKQILKMLQEYEGTLNFATDAWSSPNHCAFVAIMVIKSHSGENLAEAFAEILQDFAIEDKILSITCDNTSNNETIVAELSALLPNFPEPVKIELATELELEEVVTEAKLGALPGNEDNDDIEGLVDEMQLLSQQEHEIIHSTTKLLPSWYDHLNKLRLKQRLMPRDIATCWNSTFDMLQFALEYRKALDAIAGDQEMDLRSFELLKDEWRIAAQLCDVLKILKDATMFFSRSTPNLATVIPAMDHIDHELATNILRSEEYTPAIFLHPRHKTSYFTGANWEPKWIEAVKGIVCTEFNRSYAVHVSSEDEDDPLETQVDDVYKSLMQILFCAQTSSKNIFDNLPALSAPKRSELRDELDSYLGTNPEAVTDALKWWHEKYNLIFIALI
ncbi:hypothetical protein EW146_g4452 [Bondarzewia mesenterica]|uniref:HAT C-terminal dimerisation domain-containing protein n=1 Tax=Bondarzewia mesenterica TaxID=1095465 RepID=A0A4S4LUI2_9AGAM|nr:hypothetical protein EW146_g4452 [Bondarzewia mesenterica]